MIQAGQGAGFAEKLVAGLGQGLVADACRRPYLFDGAQTTGQASVRGLVHRAHASLADEALDLVSVSQECAGF
jgi:hypothetical protein